MDASTLWRSTLGAASAAVAIGVIFWVQAKFDGADRKNAVLIVQQYHSKTGWSVPDVLKTMHPNGVPAYSVKTESSCMQAERVKVSVDDQDYEFMIAINGPSIHPGNALGEKVLAHLDDPPAPAPSATPAANASAAPSASAAPK